MVALRKIRVLHVLGALNPGGVETWLLHVMRHVDRSAFQVDFLVHTTQPAVYDDEIRALGGRIISCPEPQRPWRYARRFNAVLNEYGPYDVVHSHVHDYSGYVLRLARRAGVPVRIAHSHNDTTQFESQAGILRKNYLALMKHWIQTHATVGLGCSRRAATCLFGKDWQNDDRMKLLFCGIDLAPFQAADDGNRLRDELNIPRNAFVVGHVGRFNHQKNHRFLVETFAEIACRDPQARLLLVGDGPLRPEIEQQATDAGLQGRVIFAGLRRDVPKLMTSVMDAFLFPSHFEGLPIVLLETQAAGLPCIVSDVIDEGATIIPSLMNRLSLEQSASAWAETTLAARKESAPASRLEAQRLVSETPFNIHVCIENLQQVYRSELQAASTGRN